jgi:hypothetical protein
MKNLEDAFDCAKLIAVAMKVLRESGILTESERQRLEGMIFTIVGHVGEILAIDPVEEIPRPIKLPHKTTLADFAYLEIPSGNMGNTSFSEKFRFNGCHLLIRKGDLESVC